MLHNIHIIISGEYRELKYWEAERDFRKKQNLGIIFIKIVIFDFKLQQ